jgi:hypothetical protein
VAVEIVVDRTEERALELTIRLGAREALDLHLVSQGVPDAEGMTAAPRPSRFRHNSAMYITRIFTGGPRIRPGADTGAAPSTGALGGASS